MKKCFIIVLFFILSSCIYTITDYTPNIEQKLNVNLSNKDKKDITFDLLVLDRDGIDYNGQYKKKLVNNIRKALENSKLFRKISYVENGGDNSKYHYWFVVKFTKRGDKIFSNEFLSMILFHTIPTETNGYNIDITMHVRGYNEIYSITTTETIKEFAWLPLCLISPFLNLNKAVNNIEKKIFNYFINEIINNKLY